MATIRYRIRNEYGLGSSELYCAADRNDPEAILQGVAVAGLIGLLRQLGDLADFSAEVFNELHEEVMNLTSREHKLMLRVQRLEREVPSIEKGFFPQRFSYREGIDWHCNLQKGGHDLVSTGEMPHSVMNAYRACRGPPQLFKLDKFDVSGNGTCLKRYTDPSFYSLELTSKLEQQDAQEKERAGKVKKKVSFIANSESPESLSSRLQPCTTDQVFDRPLQHVKVKSRQLNESIIHTLRNYMVNGIVLHSLEEQIIPKNSASQSTMIKPGHSTETDETVANASSSVDKGSTSSLNKQEIATENDLELKIETSDEEMATIKNAKKTVGHYSTHQAVNKVDQNGSLGDDKGRSEHSPDCYISDENSSELGNFMDAHTTTESKIETDDEQVRPDFLGIHSEESDFDSNDEVELKAQYPDQYLHENSTSSPGFCTMFNKGTENPYFSDTLGHLAMQLLKENKNESCIPPNSDVNPSKNIGIASATASIASGEQSCSHSSDSTTIPSGNIGINRIASSSEKISDQALRHLYDGFPHVQSSSEIPGEGNSTTLTQPTAETFVILSENLYDLTRKKHLMEDEPPKGIDLNKHIEQSMARAADTTLHLQDPHETTLHRVGNDEEIPHASSSTKYVKLQEFSKEDEEPLYISPVNSNETIPDVIFQNAVQTFKEAFGKESNSEPNSSSFLQDIPSAVHFVEDIVAEIMESSETGHPLGSKPTTLLASNNSKEQHIIISELSDVDGLEMQVEVHRNLILSDFNGEDHEPSERTSPAKNALHDDVINSQEASPHNIADGENYIESDMPEAEQQLEIASGSLHSDKDGTIKGDKKIPQIAQLPPIAWRLTKPPMLPVFENESSQLLQGVNVPATVQENDIHYTLKSSRKTMGEALASPLEEDKKVHDKDITISSSDETHPSTLLEATPNVNERSQNGAVNLDGTPTSLSVALAIEDERLNQIHETINGSLPPTAPFPMGRPIRSEHGSLSLEDKTSSTFQDLTSLTSESEKPQRRAHSVIIRPNALLIESVASHDKSKKLPDLIHASAMPNRDERGSFLEQIKNKSFSLKPTVAPTMKFKGGPPTNLKVIAILEKANAIRQACAGSDEDDDDDDDNWSDS
ncbi:protein SCAR2-like isoform X1 [Zingiber officinale]|uniref:protein SCAR2-like isoform X1 n=1 Tax=Zingiber officinale TaxID=94328 RepID=UPI001C4B6BF1|nr:protein SCAR2-like isoform X1 [Zingiber officinale]